jgi:hypothetical protein
MNDVMKKHLDLVRTIDMYYDLNGLTNKTIYLGHTIKSIR